MYAIALNVDIFDQGGAVLVRHVFYGRGKNKQEAEAEADQWKEHHIETCEYFQSAVKEGRIGEFTEEIDEDEIPHADNYKD